MAAISGKVRLRVDTEANAPPGFIMYLPVYAQGKPHNSVEERRAHLIGWVFAGFRMNDFMASLYGNQSPGLALAMYDDTEPNDAALIYRAGGNGTTSQTGGPATLTVNEYMVVAGHNWTLSLSTQQAFEDRFGRGSETITAVAGVGLSVLLALLAWLLANGRERALRLAESMTEELRHMAQHDPLTDLPNRGLFNDRLAHELALAKRVQGRFAMVFLDLDYFKPINDNYGHHMGDELLLQFARRLQNCVRAADTVGRIGGDEFVVLISQVNDAEHLQALAEKLHQTMRSPFTVDGHELSISCSLGVAVYPDHGTDAAALTKSADQAMYRAKEAGRDCVRVCPPSEGSAG